MADYFALLATRLVGAPDAVRPVLAARFETPPAVAPAASMGDAGATLHEETIEQPAPNPRPRPRLRRAPPPPPPLRASDDVSDNPKTSPSARPAPPPVVPTPPITPASNQAPPRPAPLPVSSTRSTSSAEAFSEASETPTPASPRPSAAAPPPPPTNPPARPVSSGLDKGIEPSTPFPAPRAHLPIDPPGRPAAPEIVSDRPLRFPVPPAAPSIQISIGHIEVQAVLPKAGSPTVTPPKTQRLALSLEDYLARRNAPRP